mgnify:CR=1 FL=1
MKYKDLLHLLIKDLDNNLERLDQHQIQNIQSQQLEYSNAVRELTKGIEILKKHVVKQVNKE